MPAVSNYSDGNYGVGAYGSPIFVDISGVVVAAFALLGSASVFSVTYENAAGVVVAEFDASSSAQANVVRNAVGSIVATFLISGGAYGGPYWVDPADGDTTWTPVPIDETTWVPIEA